MTNSDQRVSFMRAAFLAALALTPTLRLDAQPSTAKLKARVQARLDSLQASTAVYAKNLATGAEIAIRADVPMNTASVIKIPVMVLAERDADAGRFDLDERYIIRPEDLRRGSGLLQTFAPGLSPTYRDLATQMIITSDNTATDIMIGKVGLDRVNAMLREMGYANTRLLMTTGDLFREVWVMADPNNRSMSHRDIFERGFPTGAAMTTRMPAFVADSTKWLGRTTAREISRMLEEIETCKVASKRGCDELRAVMRRQFYSSRLPQRIGSRAAIGHKTGDWPPYLGNDVGIIYHPGGPTVISVFTSNNRGSFFELEATIGRIAEDVLNAWAGQR
jgi:beta-lactamase class A